MDLTRRHLIAAGAVWPFMPTALAAPPVSGEGYWAGIAAQYDTTPGIVQLENGNWGIMARPVLAAYERNVEKLNHDNSFYARRGMADDMKGVQARLASALGVGVDEVVMTRNASEALKALIVGYNRLRPGDAVLHADLDYNAMSACMESLEGRRGVTVVKIALPEPATHQGVIDAYAAAFAANPRIRLVLLTHLSNRNGLVIPVKEIVALARSKDIDAIVDAAHSWGQLEGSIADLGADFVGVNLHKWVGAPMGVGAMIVRRDRVDAIDPDPAEEKAPVSVQSRVHLGTADFAAQLTVPTALDFQAAIGGAARAARLRALRDRWAEQLRGMDGLEILTPSDPRLHCGITSFRIRGLTTPEENRMVAKVLLEKYRIFSVSTVVAKGGCLRITPALFTTPAHIDALVVALKEMVQMLKRAT